MYIYFILCAEWVAQWLGRQAYRILVHILTA